MENKSLYREAAMRIRKLRKQYGFTREELAELTGVSAKHIYEIEAGRKGFSAGVLYRLATVLGVDCDYIMTGEKDRN